MNLELCITQTINTNKAISINGTSAKSAKGFDFCYCENQDLDAKFKQLYESMSDTQQEAYLQTIEKLKKQGASSDDVDFIHLYLIYEAKNQLESIELSSSQKELVEEYTSSFKELHEAILKSQNDRLKLKKLQQQTLVIDKLLQVKDRSDGNLPNLHKLNIEV